LPAFGKFNKRGKVEDKSAHFPFKNIFKKVKKKLASLFKIQYSVPKPNQTNGETNDKQCAK
jgi:hypothetical protein